MPYIKQIDRTIVNPEIEELVKKLLSFSDREIAGALNYSITKVMSTIHKERGRRISYDDQNTIVGMLECCKLEWYRRRVAPYEDEKIEENGDV